jgi:hypothetical protein
MPSRYPHDWGALNGGRHATFILRKVYVDAASMSTQLYGGLEQKSPGFEFSRRFATISRGAQDSGEIPACEYLFTH